MTSSTITATFACNIEKVWNIVTSLENYSWRSDLSRIEIVNEAQFVEYTTDGFATAFTITSEEPCKRWEFDMENGNMKGHWTGIFSEIDGQTQITFTEEVMVKKPLMKLFIKPFLKKQQARYIADLQKIIQNNAEEASQQEPPMSMHYIETNNRAINIETSSGQQLKNVPHMKAEFYMGFVANGKEDFVVFSSHDGFLQFYGIDNQFVAEMRINYPNGDFRTFSFINPEKENVLSRISLETPFGQYTPMEREVLSFPQLRSVVENYYRYSSSEEFVRKVPCVDTTVETKKYMGL